MSTQETPLSAFFSRYEFDRYTYDPDNDPDHEYQRLCIARRWGDATIARNHEGYLSALRTSGSPVDLFFYKFRVPGFTHNPLANQQMEFDRLQEASGEVRRREFRAAMKRETAPIVVFLRGQEISGYRYGLGPAELEFKKLVEARRGIWEQGERRVGRNGRSRERRSRWRASPEFAELHEGFYKAVEEQFDSVLDKIACETRLRRDEVLVELFCAGEAPLSKEEAETALESVYVNIYDFLDVIGTAINTEWECETQNLIQLLSPRARLLEFPSDAMLAVYSALTRRGFPYFRAKQDGALILLLRETCQDFVDFQTLLEEVKEEGGRGLDRAVGEGPNAVRELLLSRGWESLEGDQRDSE